MAAAVLLCCCYSHEFSKSVDFFVLLLLSFFTFLFLFAHTVITLFSQDATPLHRLCTIHRGTLFDGMKTRFEGSQILAAQLAAELEIERAQRAEQERLAAEQHERTKRAMEEELEQQLLARVMAGKCSKKALRLLSSRPSEGFRGGVGGRRRPRGSVGPRGSIGSVGSFMSLGSVMSDDGSQSGFSVSDNGSQYSQMDYESVSGWMGGVL